MTSAILYLHAKEKWILLWSPHPEKKKKLECSRRFSCITSHRIIMSQGDTSVPEDARCPDLHFNICLYQIPLNRR